MQPYIVDLDGLTTPAKAARLEATVRQYFGITSIDVDFVQSRLIARDFDLARENELLAVVQRRGVRVLPSKLKLRAIFTIRGGLSNEQMDQLEKALSKLPWVSDYYCDEAKAYLRVSYKSGHDPLEIVGVLSQLGLDVSLQPEELNDRLRNVRDYGAIVATMMLVMGSVFVGLGQLSPQWSVVPFFVAILVGVWPLLEDGIIAAFNKRALNFSSMIFIFVMIAVSREMWFEAAFVLTTFMIAQFLERQFFRRIRQRLLVLRNRLPRQANVLVNGSLSTVKSEDLRAGDIQVVRAAEVVACDGVIDEGFGNFRSFGIGEKAVQRLHKGETVFAGYRLSDGEVRVKVVADQSHSRWAILIRDLHDACNSVFPEWTTIRKWVLLFSFVCISLAVGLFWASNNAFFSIDYNISTALALLLISGPVAISSTTQGRLILSIVHLAERGVLLKRGDILSYLAGVNRILFDKQGVITKGESHVEEVIAMHEDSISELTRIATSLIDPQVHDYFRAIASRAQKDGISAVAIVDRVTYGEQGFSAKIDGEQYLFGSYRLIKEHGFSNAMIEERLDRWQTDGVDSLFLASSKGVIGVFNVVDPLQSDAALCIDGLHALGIEQVDLLTEDNHKSAEKMAHRIGFDNVFAELDTQDKAARLTAEKSDRCAVLSARAVLLESAGRTRISIRSLIRSPEYAQSDVAVLGDELQMIPESMSTARRSLNQLRNLSLVFISYKLMIIAAVLALLIPLWATMVSELLFTYAMWLAATREGLLNWINPANQPRSIMQLPPPRKQRIFSPGLIR